MPKTPFGIALALGLLGSLGCQGRSRIGVHPVEGKLTVGGRPAAGARVAFHPLREGIAEILRPVAVTQPDGCFRLTTFAAGDGAPAGEYAVTLLWPDDSLPVDECIESAHDRLKGRYADPATSPIRVTVVPGRNSIPIKAAVVGNWSFPRLRDKAEGSTPRTAEPIKETRR